MRRDQFRERDRLLGGLQLRQAELREADGVREDLERRFERSYAPGGERGDEPRCAHRSFKGVYRAKVIKMFENKNDKSACARDR